MDVLGLIYALFIGPLELFFEVLYAIAYRFIGDPGYSIIFLSLAMNFLVLPLYRRADAMQEAERERAQRMKHWTDHIKRTFKGDERFMMLQTYNRQCGYKPTDALKGSVSLLLEIPFFIAAYHFLSNLTLLQGVPFGPIADLGAPDGLIAIGGVTINLLPILMTAINLVSAVIYMKGLPLSNKIQMYGIAAIFLVLLYNSPAGLVFYWTLNNVFSLVKNVFYRLKRPGFVLAVLASLTGIALIAFAIAQPLPTPSKQAFVIVAALALQFPLAVHFFRRRHPARTLPIPEATPADTRTFVILGILLAFLTGAIIPLAVLQASPTEFVSAITTVAPLYNVAYATALAVGLFVIWFGVFYWLMTPRGKTIFICLMLALLAVGLVNYLAFVPDLGNLSPTLQYENKPVIGLGQSAVNLLACGAAAAAAIALYFFKKKAVRVICASLAVAAVVMTVAGSVDVHQQTQTALTQGAASTNATAEDEPHVTLSKDGKNVVVIMLDRAIGYYVPYLVNENPALLEGLQGFTYYPNAVSYGIFTNFGVPGLYGGYEYTPEAMNARSDQTIPDKHDEALKLMPKVFMDAGFEATFFDPTYAGYSVMPDLSAFDDMPGLRTSITMDGVWDTREGYSSNGSSLADRPRNFFCYSLFRILPTVMRVTTYNNGNYNSSKTLAGTVDFNQVRHGASRSKGLDSFFMDSYAQLQRLPDMTKVEEGAQNQLFIMSNDTAHSPCILQEPEYIPSATVDNTAFDEAHRKRYAADGSYLEFPEESGDMASSPLMHYEVNMAALRELCSWFDYLREAGVWDNTRIIIVSDHGRNLDRIPGMHLDVDHEEGWRDHDLLIASCLLMVKDFGSNEFTVDDTLMTNADTPALAMQGLIDNPTNPFTGNPITTDGKNQGINMFFSYDWEINKNNGNTYLPGWWFTVKDNIYDINNWKYLGYY